jgi:hypothetical protein
MANFVEVDKQLIINLDNVSFIQRSEDGHLEVNFVGGQSGTSVAPEAASELLEHCNVILSRLLNE